MPPEVIDGSGADLAENGFELGEDLFDGIEIGAVGRQVERGCADRLNGLVYAGDLWEERLSMMTMSPADRVDNQGLLDPGKEACAVDLAIENAGRGDPVVTQGGNELVVFQWPWGMAATTRSTARCPAITPGHASATRSRRERRRSAIKVARCAKWLAQRRESGRSCSAAWAVFFCDSAPEPEESRQASSASPRSPRRPAIRKARQW